MANNSFHKECSAALLEVFRKQAECEAGVSCLEIETTLALALADVCQWLNLRPEQVRRVLGGQVHQVVNDAAVPLVLAQAPSEQTAPALA